jgi:hypothetical protein
MLGARGRRRREFNRKILGGKPTRCRVIPGRPALLGGGGGAVPQECASSGAVRTGTARHDRRAPGLRGKCLRACSGCRPPSPRPLHLHQSLGSILRNKGIARVAAIFTSVTTRLQRQHKVKEEEDIS